MCVDMAVSYFTSSCLSFIMRLSSLRGAAYCVELCLSVCLSVCPSVCLSVCPSVPLWDEVLLFYSRTVLRANIQNRKTSVFAYGPASHMYFSARAEGRISYGHLGRTNSCSTVVCVSYLTGQAFYRLAVRSSVGPMRIPVSPWVSETSLSFWQTLRE